MVNSGSQITILGKTFGWKIIFFSYVCEFVITLARPTSDPVPAVVGTAIIAVSYTHLTLPTILLV